MDDIRAPFCIFRPPILTEEEANKNLPIYIPNYPKEEFKYISDIEDIVPFKYFISSYGRVFTNYGKELFPEFYETKNSNTYCRIELSCNTYIKRRKFLIHRLVALSFIPKTQEDIEKGRDFVNHKYNKDGRCNYVWNLEWTTISENTLHGIYYNEPYDPYMFNIDHIMSRRSLISDYYFGDNNPKSRISEYQAHLICYAYTVLHYSLRDCALYAWLEGTKSDVSLVSSIVNGYSWPTVITQYGIEYNPQHSKKRANPKREEFKEEYEAMVEEKIKNRK